MPYYDGRWHLYSEALRRAYGEARREGLSKAWHAKWISKGGLKTTPLVRALFSDSGKPS